MSCCNSCAAPSIVPTKCYVCYPKKKGLSCTDIPIAAMESDADKAFLDFIGGAPGLEKWIQMYIDCKGVCPKLEELKTFFKEAQTQLVTVNESLGPWSRGKIKTWSGPGSSRCGC